MRAEQLAKKYATARKLDQTEAEYIRLVEVFDFAARELVGVSARVWHDRLATSHLDPAEALRRCPGRRRLGTGGDYHRHPNALPDQD